MRLASLARRVFCVTATSVPSERVFSACGTLITKLQCSLSPMNVDAMIFLSKNQQVLDVAQVRPAEMLAAAAAPCVVVSEDEDEFEELPPLPSLPALHLDSSLQIPPRMNDVS